MLFNSNISKEEINSYPLCEINGKITIVDNAEQISDAVEELRQTKIIGFDTETKPNFRKGVSNKISLLQLATAKHCFLFRLKMLGPNNQLKELLEDKHVMKVGLSVHDDFLSLNQWMKVSPQNFLELQIYAELFGIDDKSLQKIYAIIFQKKIPKNQQLSNWEAPELTEAQKMYAARDAWACLEIYNELKNSLKHNIIK